MTRRFLGKYVTAEERYLKYTEPDSETDCLNWKGFIKPQGYGQIKVRGKTYPAHRYFYLSLKGPIPGELHIRHVCHNKKCVRLEHLLLGTRFENAQDSVRAGRYPSHKGEKNIRAKLTEERVRVARVLKGFGYSYSQLAVLFAVGRSTIDYAVSGKTWGHVA
jgi:HNH endonuclease